MKKIISLVLMFLILHVNVSEAITRIPVSREWKNRFWNAGGTYPTIIADNEIPGRLYLSSDVAGAWYSDDYGDNWKWMNTGTTTIINSTIVQSEADPGLLYIIGSQKAVKSHNRGRTWQDIGSFSTQKTYKNVAPDRTNKNIVYIGVKSGVIRRSIDGAASFSNFVTPFGSNIITTFIYIDKASTYLIVGSLNNGVRRIRISDGLVEDITPVGTNSNSNYDYTQYTDLSGVEYFCTGGGLRIACTSNFGDTWNYTTEVTGDSAFFISRLAAKQLANGQVRFLAHARRLSTQYGENKDLVSSDTGNTWTSFYTHVTRDPDRPQAYGDFGVMGNVYSFAVDPFSENRFWSTTDITVWGSTNSALDWTEKSKGAMNLVMSDVKVAPNGWWFACGMDFGLSYSTDKGITWHEAIPHTSVSDPQGFPIAGHYWRVELLGTEEDWDNGNGVVLQTASMYINNPVYVPTVWRSNTNGVGNWVNSSTGLPTVSLQGNVAPHKALWGIGYPRGLDCHPNGSACYLSVDGYSPTGQDGGIFISRDQGQTWSRTTQPSSWQVYNALAVDPTDTTGNTAIFAESFISGGAPHFWKTRDGGVTWEDAGIANYGIFDVTYNSDGNAFAVGLYTGPQVYFSPNGDNGTWGYMKTLNTTGNIADGVYADPDDSNVLYAGVNDGTSTGPGTGGNIGGSVYMTVNAKAFDQSVWVEITGDLPSPSGIAALAVDKNCGTSSKGCLIAAADGSGMFMLDLADTTPVELEGVQFE